LSGLDALVSPRLRKLGSCPAARGAAGKLRLVLRLDFVHGTTGVELGHGRSSVPDAEALLACARSDLAGTPVASVTHDNARYAVAYPVTFTTAPFAESSAGAAPLAQAGGAASDAPAFVQWDAAIIRDAPRTGKVLARLPRGTTLRVGTVSDGWYPVKYGEKYASEGWVVRGAIGR
jgi:hypothetical protein